MSKFPMGCDYNLTYALNREKSRSQREFLQVLALLNLTVNSKFLDVGCNTGEFCYLVEKRFGVKARGIDVNEQAIQIAKGRYPEIDFEVEDIHGISEKGEYDAITMIEVIEHLSRPELALKKITNALKAKGRLVLTTPNRWGVPTRLYLKIKGQQSDQTHIKIYDPISLSALVTAVGFDVERLFTSYSFRMPIPSVLFGGTIYVLATKR